MTIVSLRWPGRATRQKATTPLLFAFLIFVSPLSGQERPRDGRGEVAIDYYHGIPGQSGVVDPPGHRSRTRTLRYVVAEGDSVCVLVLNPHQGLYSYEMGSTVDTTKETEPDLSKLAAIVNPLLKGMVPTPLSSAGAGLTELPFVTDPGAALTRAESRAVAAQRNTLPTDWKWLTTYVAQLAALSSDIDRVQTSIRLSDRPVNWPGEVTPNAEGREFLSVRDTILALSTTKGRFRSGSLQKDLEEYYKAAQDAKKDATDLAAAEIVLDALHVHANNLAERVASLKRTYEEVREVRPCRAMGAGRATRFVFNVTTRDTTRKDLGRTRRDAVTINAVRHYGRPSLEVIPIGLTIFADAPRYGLVRDTIRLIDQNTLGFRPGGMVLFNALAWGDTYQWALGPGLGFGVGGEGKVLSDFLGSVMLSYRERYRIGFGAGYARVGTRLKDQYRVGQQRPTDAETIEDLLDEYDQPSVFLVFDFTGLNLASVFK